MIVMRKLRCFVCHDRFDLLLLYLYDDCEGRF